MNTSRKVESALMFPEPNGLREVTTPEPAPVPDLTELRDRLYITVDSLHRAAALLQRLLPDRRMVGIAKAISDAQVAAVLAYSKLDESQDCPPKPLPEPECAEISPVHHFSLQFGPQEVPDNDGELWGRTGTDSK